MLATAAVAIAVFALRHATNDASPGNGDARRGAAVYTQRCGTCHGAGGIGASGPPLTGERAHKTDAETIDWIEHPLAPMPALFPAALSERDVRDLASYVATL